MPHKKILIILSDADSFPLKKTSGSNSGQTIQQPSGFFLQELAKPLQKLLDAGHEVTFASPKGREPTTDPNSETLLAYAGNFYERRREHELIEKMKKENGFTRPRPFSSISDEELATFAGVFIPGGHAPLQDLGADAELGRILRYFHRENKPTAAICHGPYALLSTKKAGDGAFVYEGYKITCWSDAEEKVMETMMGGEIEKVESALREEGAIMMEGMPEKVGGTTLHRELVTGGESYGCECAWRSVFEDDQCVIRLHGKVEVGFTISMPDKCLCFLLIVHTLKSGLEFSILYKFLLESMEFARIDLYKDLHNYCPLPRAISFSSPSFADRDGIFCDFELLDEALPESWVEACPCWLASEEDFFLACSGPGCSNSRLRGLTP